MVKAACGKIMLNKPIAVGFVILELSKLIMYEFYYDVMKHKYGDKCSLLFTDTDSLCMAIQTDDWHGDMQTEIDYFDTSNFERHHKLFCNKNHRVLGKFKSETGSLQPVEFVCLQAKMYSLDVYPKKVTPKWRVSKVFCQEKCLSQWLCSHSTATAGTHDSKVSKFLFHQTCTRRRYKWRSYA